MKSIVRYHIHEAGVLWVELRNGHRRPATSTEEMRLLRMVPDLATLMGWEGPALTGSLYLECRSLT